MVNWSSSVVFSGGRASSEAVLDGSSGNSAGSERKIKNATRASAQITEKDANAIELLRNY